MRRTMVLVAAIASCCFALCGRATLQEIAALRSVAFSFDRALAIAGYGAIAKDLRLELVPTIETSLGPIRYPAPVVLRRPAK